MVKNKPLHQQHKPMRQIHVTLFTIYKHRKHTEQVQHNNLLLNCLQSHPKIAVSPNRKVAINYNEQKLFNQSANFLALSVFKKETSRQQQ